MISTLQWKAVVSDGSAYHVSRMESAAGWTNIEHDHADFSEVFFVEYGEVEHRINRKPMILGAGTLAFIRLVLHRA